MSDELVGIDIQGLPSLLDKVDAISDPGLKGGLNDVADYLREVMRKEPDYRYVSRATAYPEVRGFFSDRQRRFVMASIADGTIQPGSAHRSGRLRSGWEILGKGTMTPMLVNQAPGALWAHDDERQARQLAQAGWKKLGEVIKERGGQIARIMSEAVNKAIKRGR